MDELTDLLLAVSQRRSLSRRQLRLAIRRRGLVRLWAPEKPDGSGPESVVDDWHALVSRGVSRAELTPRGEREAARRRAS